MRIPFWALIVVSAATAQTSGIEARARQFVNLLAKGDFAAAQQMLSPELGQKLPATLLEQVWRGTEKQMGSFRQMGDARIESSGSAGVVYLVCDFEKRKLDAKIPVSAEGMIGGFNLSGHYDWIAPNYVNPTLFHEREVTAGTAAYPLHGTLTIPNGAGPFPALVLVQGSGASDRDSALGPNKIFRDIAWGAASRGVAVLRYNKRSFEHPEAFQGNFTLREESVDDALAGVALLRKTAEVDSKKIFVLGHSVGATAAPRIGKADPGIAGLILMAGTTYYLADLVVPQMIHNYTLHGPLTEAQQKQVDQMRELVAHCTDPDAPRLLGIPAGYWVDMRGYHPEQVAHGLNQRLLLLQGERDYQVTMEDFAAWKKALADRKNVEFRSYPKLNHMFLAGEGPSSDEEYTHPGHVAVEVVDDIAGWVKR
jgi:dienelactone hydrolase